MSVDLPEPLVAYFSAETANDPAALAECFTENAVVKDEGKDIQGRAAIRQWMTAAKNKYQHTTEPLSVAQRDGKTIVTAKVSGNFPNSPVTLEHAFELSGNKIISLEIH